MLQKVIAALVMGGIMAGIGIFILKDVQIASDEHQAKLEKEKYLQQVFLHRL